MHDIYDRPLHEQSHGESFLDIAINRLAPNGLYLFDEPEAALSLRGQLALMRRMHELLPHDCQFVVATHSPILLGFPSARIHLLDDDGHARDRLRRRPAGGADARVPRRARPVLPGAARMIRAVSLDSVEGDDYPFSIPAIRSLGTIELASGRDDLRRRERERQVDAGRGDRRRRRLQRRGRRRATCASRRASRTRSCTGTCISCATTAACATAVLPRAESFYNLATHVEELGDVQPRLRRHRAARAVARRVVPRAAGHRFFGATGSTSSTSPRRRSRCAGARADPADARARRGGLAVHRRRRTRRSCSRIPVRAIYALDEDGIGETPWRGDRGRRADALVPRRPRPVPAPPTGD